MKTEESGARSCIPLTWRTQSYKTAERTSNTICFNWMKRFQHCAGMYILICQVKPLRSPSKSPQSAIKKTDTLGMSKQFKKASLSKAYTPCLSELATWQEDCTWFFPIKFPLILKINGICKDFKVLLKSPNFTQIFPNGKMAFKFPL